MAGRESQRRLSAIGRRADGVWVDKGVRSCVWDCFGTRKKGYECMRQYIARLGGEKLRW